LNAIIGYSEMLQEDATDQGAGALVPDLKKVNAAGKHLLELINSILDLSKIEAGKMELHLEDFSVAEIVSDIAAMVQPLAEKNGNRVDLVCDPQIGVMHADLTKVRQVLFNLLSNACKFTEKGTVSLATLYNGQYFGELSLFDGSPRSATASAMRQSHLVRLDRDDIVDFVNKNPQAALRIIAEMSERLRQTNELMSRQVSRNVLEEAEESLTFGQRVADRVAAFGGSWPFIFTFSLIMTVWMGLNIFRFANYDPYPFILLNLCLSTVAALQAPVIMMSQNRQSAKDKAMAVNDYQVNLKNEVSIDKLIRSQGELVQRIAHIERMMVPVRQSILPG